MTIPQRPRRPRVRARTALPDISRAALGALHGEQINEAAHKVVAPYCLLYSCGLKLTCALYASAPLVRRATTKQLQPRVRAAAVQGGCSMAPRRPRRHQFRAVIALPDTLDLVSG
jgi:hypothetical protein